MYLKMDWRKLRFWRTPTGMAATPGCEIVSEHDSTNPEQGDAAVVAALRKAGADISQPREVLHFFYFPNKAHAEEAAAELRREGMNVRDPISIETGTDTPNPWSVRATINAVVSLAGARECSSRFRALASQHNGEYDGWEAAARP
jgi:hypothetical protein